MHKFLLIFFLVFSFHIKTSNVSFDLQSDYFKKFKEKICTSVSFPKEIKEIISQFVAEDFPSLYVKVKVNINRPFYCEKGHYEVGVSKCTCDIHSYDLIIPINKYENFKDLKEKVLNICLAKEKKYFTTAWKYCKYGNCNYELYLPNPDEIQVFLFDELVKDDQDIICFKQCLMYSENYPIENYFAINLISNALCDNSSHNNQCIIL